MIDIEIFSTPSKSLLDRLYRELVLQDCYDLNSIKEPVDYVIDIGANIGVFSVYAEDKLTINKGIVCLEPHTDNFTYLKTNINSNIGCSKLDTNLFNQALGDGSLMYMNTTPKNLGMYQCFTEEMGGNVVNTLTLKEIVSAVGITPDDTVVLKCDCEGGEVNLMNDESMALMTNFLRICIEVHFGDEYFSHCPTKEEYKQWLNTFNNFIIYSQSWNSTKNGHVTFRRK